MNQDRRFTVTAIVAVLGMLGGCESLPEEVIARPDVSLRDVQVTGLGFSEQTFLLSFSMHNPNPFPLPVNHVSYGIRLDGQRFASGNTPCEISIPASGDSDFSISVELDLLASAPQLLSIVRDSTRGEVAYELEGQLGLDLPLAPAVRFRDDGSISIR